MWQDIDELLGATAAAAKTAGEPRGFYTVFLEGVVQAVGGVAGGVWYPARDGRFNRVCERQLDEFLGSARTALLDDRLLALLARQATPTVLPPQARLTSDSANPLEQTLLAGPVLGDDNQLLSVVVILQEPAVVAIRPEQGREVFAAFCELAADFHRRCALRALQEQQRRQQAFDQFAVRVHRPGNVEATAYTIANDGRQIIGCDRLAVVTLTRGQPRTRAVSGVDTPERRSSTLRALEALAQNIARVGEPIHSYPSAEACPAELVDVAEAYRDASLAQTITAVPLFLPQPHESSGPPRIAAVLVAESFVGLAESERGQRATIEAVARHAAAALANALAFERIPWSALWRRVDPWFSMQANRRWSRALILGIAVGMVVLLGMVVPAELTIPARGRLQPAERRAVFAPADGVIDELLVDHGDHVAAAQLLLRLDNPALDLETTRITGELVTAEQQLRSVRAKRWSAERGRAVPGEDASQLAAHEEALVALVASLEAQQQLVAAQQQELEVCSPIAGRVVTWRVAELLRKRPVARGQELLTIADETGPWLLELDVADGQIRQVLSAQAQRADPLEVRFRLATDPNAPHVGQVRRLAGASQPRPGTRPVVPVEVDFDKQQVPLLRPGAEVTARIHCGRRSVAYVWLHELWEWLAARVW